eukprot:CAMPEP_0185738048 /NCGR_PEP_ID=MMETSP1171-20130828/31896_1 /TAXON_ID=374046 /ORGANISM="Helicotheca tamensis, Strain CCMP826" /LENGTH=192 /DNA_ID=CAMNT_0028409141 /DNA_START=63 /DNA_END=638 /DNA_ORIENTATION=-
MTSAINEPTISLLGNSSEEMYQTTDVLKRNETSSLEKKTKHARVHFADGDTTSAPTTPMIEKDLGPTSNEKNDLETVMLENFMMLNGLQNESTSGLNDISNKQLSKVVKSVLREQEKQRFDGIDDKEKIALASSKRSTKPSKSAYSRAKKVEKEVGLYQRKVKKTNKKSKGFISRTKRMVNKVSRNRKLLVA